MLITIRKERRKTQGLVMVKLLAISTCFLTLWSGFALAQAQCDAALVLSTYTSWDSSHVDWRLSTMVTKEGYDTIKHDTDANGTIYGIPVGANYDDFHNRVEQEMNSRHESLTTDQARNVMWTGLDPHTPRPRGQSVSKS